MKRREFLTLSSGMAVVTLSGCSTKQEAENIIKPQNCTHKVLKPKTKKRVVIVGGGFGGLNTASSIKDSDKENLLEVIVVERNQNYFACPMSNTLLSGDPYFKREMFMFDYTSVQMNYNYEVIQGEVVEIDRNKKKVVTSKGCLEYDILVLAPGIEYNYEVEFPHWSQEKIRQARFQAPGGLISDVGVEHSILLKQLEDFKAKGEEGSIVVIPPRTKLIKSLEESQPYKSIQRCKPAPYERACMIGNWIKRNNLVGKAKVIVLDSSARPQAKPQAFEETFSELYDGILEYVGGFDLMDVDFDKKKIFYRTVNDDAEYIQESMDYDVLNLVPIQKASPLITMAGIKTNSWGGAILAKNHFYSQSDDSIYVIGDSADYGKGTYLDNPKKKGGIPAAAQTAYSSAKVAGEMISQRLLTGEINPIKTFSASCFSMVESDTSRLGIAIYKDFYFSEKGMSIKEEVPKIKGHYYSTLGGEGLLGWFEAVTGDTFANF